MGEVLTFEKNGAGDIWFARMRYIHEENDSTFIAAIELKSDVTSVKGYLQSLNAIKNGCA